MMARNRFCFELLSFDQNEQANRTNRTPNACDAQSKLHFAPFNPVFRLLMC